MNNADQVIASVIPLEKHAKAPIYTKLVRFSTKNDSQICNFLVLCIFQGYQQKLAALKENISVIYA